MSARERFFNKVRQSIDSEPPGANRADDMVRAFCQRMDDLAKQIEQWFAGSGIAVRIGTKHIHDLSTLGYSLSSGICRYDIATVSLHNHDRRVTIVPEQLCREGETGCVTLRVEAPGGSQRFFLCMAPERGWLIRREHQPVNEGLLMTEEQFFLAVDRLA